MVAFAGVFDVAEEAGFFGFGFVAADEGHVAGAEADDALGDGRWDIAQEIDEIAEGGFEPCLGALDGGELGEGEAGV
jgi:hypothetical protein